MKYVIHTYPKRLWYVNDYLIPSMIKQGIKSSDIVIFNDKNKLGNLQAFIESCKIIEYDAWHLQDDVIISSKFRDKTEILGRLNRIICGYCNYEFNKGSYVCTGFTKPKFMFMSFPCTFIPKVYLKEFYNWINESNVQIQHKELIESKKNDDLLFYTFLNERLEDIEIYNCKECLVDHIDYLIGGSSINNRLNKAEASFWKEKELNKELERRLKNDNRVRKNI